MPRYMTWYSTGEYGKLWFDAESEEDAQNLLEQVRSGELAFEDLPAMNSKIKGGDGFEFDNLEEIED